MADISYTPAGLRAYLAGRQLAHLMSVDPATAVIPPEHAADSEAYREGIVDEQAGAPLPPEAVSPSATPKADPPVAVKAPPPPVSAAEKRRKALKEFLGRLKLQPLDTIRSVAERQIAQVESAFKEGAPYYSKTIQRDYAGIKERLAGARANLAGGDSLRGKPDEASQTERRNEYLRAYTAAYSEADNLAATVGDESFLVLTIGNIVIPAAAAAADAATDAAKGVIQAGKDAVGQVGSSVKVVGFVLAGGAALALAAFASQAGKRR